MNIRIIKELAAKDIRLLLRDRFFLFISLLGLAFVIAAYLLLPGSVDEKIEMGLYAPEIPRLLSDELAAEGIVVKRKDSRPALKQAVAEGELSLGVALSAGENTQVQVFFAPEFPEEMQEFSLLFMEELVHMLAGKGLPVEFEEIVLGPDMVGRQISVRQKLLPLFVIMLLLMEILGISSLMTTEIENGTLQALLITPVKLRDIFFSKGFLGVCLAFLQVLLLLFLVGSLKHQALIVLTALLLGAGLITGIGFLMAAASKDIMSIVGWVTPVFLIIMLPPFTVLFPGLLSGWIKIIPSFYLVDVIHKAANLNIGWQHNWVNLVSLLGFNMLFIWLGIQALKRRIA